MRMAKLFNNDFIIEATIPTSKKHRKPKDRDWSPEKQEDIEKCLHCKRKTCHGYCEEVGHK